MATDKIIYLGIDPGFTGAVAALDDSFTLLSVTDTPIFRLPQKGKKGYKTFLDIGGCCSIIRQYPKAIAAIEAVHSLPKQGVSSSFRFGEGFGIWKGILGALNIPYEAIPPQTWKKELGLIGSDKSDSVAAAMRLVPTSAPYLSLKKHHGRAEAILLAYYLAKKNAKQKKEPDNAI